MHAHALLVAARHPQTPDSRVIATDVIEGFRITAADGTASFPMSDVIAIEMRIRGIPFEAWVLAATAWPPLGPRTIRVPDVADLQFEVPGLPDDGKVVVMREAYLGLGRVLWDGPTFPPVMDEDARRIVAERKLAIPVLTDDEQAAFTARDPILRFPIAVGREQTLWLCASKGDRDVVDLPVRFTATAPGPLRITKSWAELLEAGQKAEAATPPPPK